MERQAKDGTVYQQVGPDDWAPVTRQAKDGTVYKKVGSDEWAPLEMPKPSEVSVGDKAMAAAEGMSDSVTLGTLPYLKAGAETVADLAAEKFLDAPADTSSFSDRVARARDQGKQAQAKAPGYAMAGQVAGLLIPGSIVSKGVTRGAQLLSRAPLVGSLAEAVAGSGKARELYRAAKIAEEAGNAKRAATLIKAARADLASQGVKLAAEGAVFGGAYTPESGFTDVGARVDNAATGAVAGLATPFALRGAGNVMRGTGNAVSSGSRKVLSAFGGVKEEVIKRYLKDAERIRGARTMDEIYEQVTGVVRRVLDDFDSSKADYETARAHLDDAARAIKESRAESKGQALEQVRLASAQLDEAFKAKKQIIAGNASPSRIEPQVSDALGNQKARVIKGSKEAFEILNQQKGAAKVDDIAGAVDEIDKGLYIGQGPNKVLKNDSAEAGARLLNKWRTKLYAVSDKNGDIQLPVLKQIIQGIDDDMRKYGNRASSDFNEAAENAMFDLRRSIDSRLKTIQPYAEKMAQVADDAGTLSRAQKQFGNDATRSGRLANLGRPSAKYDREILEQLAAKEGGELQRATSEMVEAQRTLKSPTRLESIRQGLPENQNLRSAEMASAVAKRMAKPSEIRKSIERSGAFFKKRSAEANMKSAKELADKFRGFGEQGAEAKLKQVAQGRKFATKTLSELSRLADDDFVEAVHAAQDAAAFTKTAFNGSRNVNFWTVMGALGQSVTGKGGAGAAGGFVLGGPVGMAMGAVVGGMMDVYGPRVTKKILDGVIAIKGPITEKAIQAIDVPEPVKRELISQFKTTVLAGRAAMQAGERALPRAAQAPIELDMDSGVPANYEARDKK